MNAENAELNAETPIAARVPFYRNNVFWAILLLFLGTFALRLLLSNVIHGHPTDINNFKAWSMHAARHPFSEFYKSVSPKGIWADYPPLYILVLWLLGRIQMIFDPTIAQWAGPGYTLLIKLPALLADLGCMGFIILILRRYVPLSLACFAAFVFALHPAVLYESALWGQIDSITLLLQLAALWMMLRKDYAAAIVMTALNILVKPQGLVLLPLIIAVALYRRQYMHLLIGAVSSLVVTFVLTSLFVPIPQILPWLMDQYLRQADLYSYSSIQAFNLWSLTGMWASDTARGIFGLGAPAPAVMFQHKTWGLILFSIAYAGSLWFFWRNDRKGEPEGVNLWHTSTLIMLAFFFLPTRMHERYLYCGLFFLLGSMILQRKLVKPFVLLSITFMLNLFYELPGHKTELKFADALYFINNLLDGKLGPSFPGNYLWYKPVAFLNLAAFAWIVYILFSEPIKELSQKLVDELERIWAYLRIERGRDFQIKDWIPAPMPLDRTDVKVLAAILGGTAILKLWRLGFPPEMVFDEVYHARAAGEYINAIKPLEWVHPPLAKLMIAVGVQFYELTGVGWRVVPVIGGTLLLAAVYLLGRFTLPQRWQAIAATLMLSCDGVYFVQSRMAMTNIFATCFQVSALTLVWRFLQHYWHDTDRKRTYVYFLLSILMIGLALSTRWTSLYSYGYLILTLGFVVLVPASLQVMGLVQSRVRPPSGGQLAAMWILIPALTVLIPVVLYAIAYSPYYINYGYDLGRVVEEQRGIWNYHKNLADPHPYYSAWYTWPWLGRPTWYYFQNYGNNLLGGILAVGNPAIWWFSMPCVLLVLSIAWIQRRLNLFYIALACFFMYLPWGMSPRTLNYAHYFFEAVPYACLSAAALMGMLVHQYKQAGKKVSLVYFGLVVGLFLLFYPIYSALPIPWQYYNLLRWFPTWV